MLCISEVQEGRAILGLFHAYSVNMAILPTIGACSGKLNLGRPIVFSLKDFLYLNRSWVIVKKNILRRSPFATTSPKVCHARMEQVKWPHSVLC